MRERVDEGCADTIQDIFFAAMTTSHKKFCDHDPQDGRLSVTTGRYIYYTHACLGLPKPRRLNHGTKVTQKQSMHTICVNFDTHSSPVIVVFTDWYASKLPKNVKKLCYSSIRIDVQETSSNSGLAAAICKSLHRIYIYWFGPLLARSPPPPFLRMTFLCH